MKKHLGLIICAVLVLCGGSAGARGSLALIQSPQPNTQAWVSTW